MSEALVQRRAINDLYDAVNVFHTQKIEAKIAEVIVPPPLLTADYLHFSAISLSLSVYIYIERERSTSQMLRVTG